MGDIPSHLANRHDRRVQGDTIGMLVGNLADDIRPVRQRGFLHRIDEPKRTGVLKHRCPPQISRMQAVPFRGAGTVHVLVHVLKRQRFHAVRLTRRHSGLRIVEQGPQPGAVDIRRQRQLGRASGSRRHLDTQEVIAIG